MTNENLIHIKIEYEEGLNSKKNILTSQMNFLKISKTLERYKTLRIEELKIKKKLYSKIKETNLDLKKIQIVLPKIKIPEILKRDKKIEKETIKIPEKIIKTNDSLESQLEEIQRKLSALQR